VVTHQLQVERRTAKAGRLKTDVLLLDHATNRTGDNDDDDDDDNNDGTCFHM